MIDQVSCQGILQGRTIGGAGRQAAASCGSSKQSAPELMGKGAPIGHSRGEWPRSAFAFERPSSVTDAAAPCRQRCSSGRTGLPTGAARQGGNDAGGYRRAPSAADIDVTFSRQLIDDGRDGVARNREFAGEDAARRQTMAGPQASIDDRRSELLVEATRQSGSHGAVEIDETGEGGRQNWHL